MNELPNRLVDRGFKYLVVNAEKSTRPKELLNQFSKPKR